MKKKIANQKITKKMSLWKFCKEVNKPPKKIKGIYRMWIEDDEHCYSYIGQSMDIYNRASEHKAAIEKEWNNWNDWKEKKKIGYTYDYMMKGNKKYKLLIDKLGEKESNRIETNIYFEILEKCSKKKKEKERQQMKKYDSHWYGFNCFIIKSRSEKAIKVKEENHENINLFLPRLNKLNKLHPLPMKPYHLMDHIEKKKIPGLNKTNYKNYQKLIKDLYPE